MIKFKVKAELTDNILTAQVLPEDANKDSKYLFYFYLIKDGVKLETVGWFDTPMYKWELKENGIYAVQGYIKHLPSGGGGRRIIGYPKLSNILINRFYRSSKTFCRLTLMKIDCLGRN